MRHSEAINELAAALAKAQGSMRGAKKDSANPFFKSKYADLASVSDACRAELSANGLSVVQAPSTLDDGRVSVETVLMHASGQWMAETVTGKPKDDGPQSLGSVITYLRRYALASFAGVSPEDDEYEAGEARHKTVSRLPSAPAGFDGWLADLQSVADEGTIKLREAWKASREDFRKHLTATDTKALDRLSARAKAVSDAA